MMDKFDYFMDNIELYFMGIGFIVGVMVGVAI